jgi:hypothetical protein
MQIVRMEGKDFTLYCPRTGVQVYDADGGILAPSFRGYWHIESIEQPEIHDPELQRYWEDYCRTLRPLRQRIARRIQVPTTELELPVDMDDFLQGIPHLGWLAVEFTLTGIRWGSGVQTIWTVLDLDASPHPFHRPVELRPAQGRSPVLHQH